MNGLSMEDFYQEAKVLVLFQLEMIRVDIDGDSFLRPKCRVRIVD